ncbi:hypothetical protein [Zavarzinia sp. CC-PAN008]|uniref:hypothetical protein n=1 Tax=Zavarzinia sp. CC-PAN008 TaxID=3243332 RepID=UPI003F74AB44
MSSSNNSMRPRVAMAVAIAAALALSGAGPALAQSGAGPMILVPPPGAQRVPPPAATPPLQAPSTQVPSAQAPSTLVPAPSTGQFLRLPADPGLRPAQAPIMPQPGSVAVESLAPLDPGSAGILTSDQSGLPADMWQGTPRARAIDLVRAIPSTLPSPSARSLARRLLATQAALPEGTEPGLLGARAAKLLELGYAADALALIQKAPGADRARDAGLLQAQVDAAFLAGDDDAACAGATALAGLDDRPATLKPLIYCRTLAKDGPGAQLAIDLWRDSGDSDPAFVALLPAIAGGGRASLPGDAALTPLTLAMARRAGAELPGAGQLPVALLPGIARGSGPLEQRVLAAEKAEALGLLATADLVALYAQATPARDKPKGWLARANAVTAALAEGDPARRLLRVTEALDAAAPDHLRATVGRALGGALTGLRPEDAPIPAAPVVARGLIAAGNMPRAFDWLNALRLRARGEADAAFAVLDLWPLFQVADGGQRFPWGLESPGRWIRGQAELPDRALRGWTAFQLMAAFGWDVGPQAMTLLAAAAQPTVTCGPAASDSFGTVEPGIRVAEIAARAVTVVASSSDMTGIGTFCGADRAVQALVRVGLEQEARMLAAEIALAAGL